MNKNANHLTNQESGKTLHSDIQIASGDRFIREPETFAITGLSKSQRYNLMNKVDGEGKPRFPLKYSLGDRASAWLLSEVRNWMAERIAESRPNNQEAAKELTA